MSLFAIISLLLAWPLAGYTIALASKHHALRWLAVWITALSLFSTLVWIAPPLSPAYDIAAFGEALAFVAMLIEVWPLPRQRRYTPAFLVRAILSDAMSGHVQATGGVREAVEGVVAALKLHSDEIISVEGPRGTVTTWQMQREALDIHESLFALTLFVHGVLLVNAIESQGKRPGVGDFLKIDAWALSHIAQFLATDEFLAPLFGPPMPYSQAEYRAAVMSSPQTLVVPTEQAKKARTLYEPDSIR